MEPADVGLVELGERAVDAPPSSCGVQNALSTHSLHVAAGAL